MTVQEITRILDAHSIDYEIIDNKVIADDNYTLNGVGYTDKIDLTNFTKAQLRDWLGY